MGCTPLWMGTGRTLWGMCPCVSRFSDRGASVFAFLGGVGYSSGCVRGCSVGLGVGCLTRGMGDEMLFRVGIARSVREGLVGLVGVCPSV